MFPLAIGENSTVVKILNLEVYQVQARWKLKIVWDKIMKQVLKKFEEKIDGYFFLITVKY